MRTNIYLIQFLLIAIQVIHVLCGCECVLTSPSKIPIASLGSFPNTCYKSWKNRLDSCTCEERIQNCVNRCYQLANIPRDGATAAYWKRWTCQADRRIYTPPGQPLFSHALTHEQNCRASKYEALYNKLACCRRGYGFYLFDERCIWKNYIW